MTGPLIEIPVRVRAIVRWATKPDGFVVVTLQVLTIVVVGILALIGALTLIWMTFIGYWSW
jgi:hypothetical protein